MSAPKTTPAKPVPASNVVSVDAERLTRLGEVIEVTRGYLRAVDTPGEHDAREKMFDAMARIQDGDTDPI